MFFLGGMDVPAGGAEKGCRWDMAVSLPPPKKNQLFVGKMQFGEVLTLKLKAL